MPSLTIKWNYSPSNTSHGRKLGKDGAVRQGRNANSNDGRTLTNELFLTTSSEAEDMVDTFHKIQMRVKPLHRIIFCVV